MVKVLLSIILLIPICSFSLGKLHDIKIVNDHDKEDEVLYLPSGKALKTISFGYNNLLSNILWFKTISYFGKHYQTDKNYEWLHHMCNLVVDLNPKASHVYEFCGVMLAWETEDGQKSVEILTKAISVFPERWRYYYLRGFSYMYFLEDIEKAQSDFVTASKLPDAPVFLARLAAEKITYSDPKAAINFLENAIENTDDPLQRRALRDKIRELTEQMNNE